HPNQQRAPDSLEGCVPPRYRCRHESTFLLECPPHRQSPPTLPYSPERESLDASTDRAGCRRTARSWSNRRAGIPRDPNIMISLFCSGHILVALTAILGRGIDENQVPTTAALPDGCVPVG